MRKPDSVDTEAWKAACVITTALPGAYGWRVITEAVARAIMAATLAERQRWEPAAVYFDRYCQDEAEDAENCVCGQQQHHDAKAFAGIRNRGA